MRTNRESRWRAATTLAPPAAGTATVVAAWWLATTVLGVRPFLLPAPPQVAATLTERTGYLAGNLWVTAAETLQGFLLAGIVGLALGVLLAFYPVVSRAFYPALVALHAIPKLALAPLLVVWFGFGTGPKIIMVVLVCAFPIVLATTTGLANTPTEQVELARSLGASRWQTFVKLRVPNALPDIFTGLKQAMPLAVIGAVIGELFGATAGLGYVVQQAGSDTPLVFASLALLAALSIGLFYAVVVLQRLLVPWVRYTTS